MKKILKALMYLILLVVAGFVFLIGYGTISDYQPQPEEVVYTSSNPDILSDTLEMSLMIWNIGYCGLSSDMDFFYDGGKQVFPPKEKVRENLNGVESFIDRNKNIDFWLFQEVDQSSRRSYYLNEYKAIADKLPSYISTFGKNYDVFFVPTPITKPMGAVLSGLATYSHFVPQNAVRYSFPGNYAWPKGLFMLDRCFLVNRYNLTNGKELLVINTHNSAYDDGTLRKNQLAYLEKFLRKEYEKGNYVIVGGDWNQCPPDFMPKFEKNLMDNVDRMDIPKDYMSDWTWAYQSEIPTNRRVNAPYNPKTTLTTVIDYFLLSPNLELKELKGINLNFQYSDHNPVFMKVVLKH